MNFANLLKFWLLKVEPFSFSYFAGSAIGFKLDSLLKLSDTRARNNKMTLMHYLCKVEIIEKFMNGPFTITGSFD